MLHFFTLIQCIFPYCFLQEQKNIKAKKQKPSRYFETKEEVYNVDEQSLKKWKKEHWRNKRKEQRDQIWQNKGHKRKKDESNDRNKVTKLRNVCC